MVRSERSIDPMQEAFEEEKAVFAGLDAKIEAKIEKRAGKIRAKKREITNWHPTDIEGRTNRMIDVRDLEREDEKIATLVQRAQSPYFGHVDVIRDDKGEAETYLVGENGIYAGGETLVYDWRSNTVNAFYNRADRRFEAGGKEWTVMLRRNVEISERELKKVSTLYDAVELGADAEVVDPFLVSVIRDKRRNYKVNDIIRTIQEDQNRIMRQPAGASFVVQGCAGSGKTMVLFHRLSYLAFNDPSTDFSKYTILTPNELFDDSVSELAAQLGISDIVRMRPEQFYSRTADLLCVADTFVEEVGGRKQELRKLPAINADSIVPDNNFDGDFLAGFYKADFLESVEERLDALRANTMQRLAEADLIEQLERRGASFPELPESIYDIYRAVSRGRAQMLREDEEARRRIADVREELAVSEAGLAKIESALGSLQERAAGAKGELLSRLNEAWPVLEQRATKSSAEKRMAMAALREAVENRSSRLERLNEIERQLADIDTATTYSSLPELIADDSEKAERIRGRCLHLYEELDNVRRQHGQAGFFDFGKRRRLQQTASELEARIEGEVAEVVAELRSGFAGDIEAMRSALSELDSQVREFDEAALSAKETERVARAEYAGARRLLDHFGTEEYPALPDDEMSFSLPELDSAMRAYGEMLSSFNVEDRALLRNGEERVSRAQERIAKASAELTVLEANLLGGEGSALLEVCREIAEMMDVRSYEAAAREELERLPGADSPKDERGFGRHDLILRLLVCSYYYGDSKLRGGCLCVDEAQDISESEYWLLGKVFGPKMSFNLYGDVEQRICPYRGLDGWDAACGYLGAQQFELAQNYRNTEQITRYCNDSLSSEMMPIGISGAKVKALPLERALDDMASIKRSEPNARIAIIVGIGSKSRVGDRIGSEFRDFVMEVPQVKGMEFDCVVVIVDGMMRNERYVAFTRALDNLLIVDDGLSNVD